MIYSKIFLFLIVLFSAFSIQYASALEIPHFFEENTICATTNSTAIVLNVTDTTDFDFISGRDYLIIATTSFGADLSSATIDIFTAHNQTKFDGGLKIIEPSNGISVACSNPNDDLNKYFFWTVWSPIGSQADEDIVISVNSTNSPSFVQYDDASISVFEISEQLTENVDWFFNSNTTDNSLAFNSFNSTNDASIQFTPTENNNDWLILGTNTIDTASAVVQYETRLFVNGTETDLPEISQEGENITLEKFVQTFARVLTLPNSTQLIEVEAQIDAVTAGNHIREYSAIFALNLDKFTSHSFVWTPAVLDVTHVGSFGTLVDSISITPLINNTDTFILADIGARDTEEQINLRLQVDNVDEPNAQTSAEYEFLDEWDVDDDLRWSQLTMENMTNVIHTIDVDGGETSNAGAKVVYRTVVAFATELTDAILNQQDIMIINDTNSFIVDVIQNQTDTMIINDTNSFIADFIRNQTDTMIINDTNSFIADFIQNQTDTLIINDTNSFIVDVIQNQSDTLIINDTNSFIVDFAQNQTDTMIINDTNSFIVDVIQNQSDTLIINDTNSFIIDVIQNQTDTMIINDTNSFIVDVIQNQSDTMIINDTNTFTINFAQSQSDTLIINDTNTFTINFAQSQSDTLIINDTNSFIADFIRNQTDTMIINDTNSFIADFIRNQADSMILNDTNISLFMATRNQTDSMVINDTNSFFISRVNDQTDSMVINDTNSFIADFIRNQSDSMIINDTNSFIVDIIQNISPVDNTITFVDGVTFFFDDFVEPPTPPVGGGGGGGVLPPTIPDSDGDGILDPEDACPLEPEDFDGFEDADGCPEGEFIQPLEPLSIPNIVDLIPFEFNELDVIDDFIELEVGLPQPQVEDLAVRWLGAEPITLTSIDIGLSPFEIQVQDFPVTFGNNRFGYTETQLLYTVQPPDKICGSVFTFDCLDEVTYKIPVVVTGEINGKTVIANGSITIDNSSRINPYWLAFFALILIPLLAILFWKRRKTTQPKTILKITQSKPNSPRTLTVTTGKPLKAGTTRKLLKEGTKLKITVNKKNLESKPPKFQSIKEKKRKNIFGR